MGGIRTKRDYKAVLATHPPNFFILCTYLLSIFDKIFNFVPYFPCYSEVVKSKKLTKFRVGVKSNLSVFVSQLLHSEGGESGAGSGQGPMVTTHDGPGVGADIRLPGKMVKQDVMPG